MAVLFLVMVSCSVKEARDDCPCRLDLFFTDRHLPADAQRNVVQGEAALLDVADSIVLSTGPRIAALGVKDLVVVATKDSVLVADKTRVQDLKKILAKFNANGS